MGAFSDWESFYILVGGAAGALVGLQFIVLTLIAEHPTERAGEVGAAFLSPNVVHFSLVLALAATLNAPWRTPTPAVVVLGVLGVGGLAYALVVARRMWTQQGYTPQTSDWVFYALLPLVGYACLAASAYWMGRDLEAGLLGVGAASLLLLLVGIRNAWDSISFMVFSPPQP